MVGWRGWRRDVGDGYDRTPDGDMFCNALAISIAACHLLSGYKISYDCGRARSRVLIADTFTIKSGKARARVLFWKYP